MSADLPISFEEVEVSIRANNCGEANFVKWTVGRFDVNEQLEVVIHLVAPLQPKPLGCLSRASAVPQDETGRSLDVKVGKTDSNLYRLVFKSAREAEVVAALADRAMLEELGVWEASNMEHDAKLKALKEALTKVLSGRRPMLYEGVQLLGQDPNGDAGSEVLLGEGILGLIDPDWRDADSEAGSRSAGEEYKLFFYGEDMKPIWGVPIGWNMVLEPQERQKAEEDDDEEPAKTFLLKYRTEGQDQLSEFTLTFESLDLADSFERDFIVRRRLMDAGHLAATQMQEIGIMRREARNQRTSSMARFIHALILIPALLLMASYYSQDIATSVCQLLLPYQCIVPCSKVIQEAGDHPPF